MNTVQSYSNPLYEKMLAERSKYQSLMESRRNIAYREKKLDYLENYSYKPNINPNSREITGDFKKNGEKIEDRLIN